MVEFERLSGVVATNIQKLVQNVSSMQRMIVHVDTQVHNLIFSNKLCGDEESKHRELILKNDKKRQKKIYLYIY